MYITLHCITSKVFVQIGLYLGKCFMKTRQKRFEMIATLTEAFHLAQNSGRKSKGVRGRGLETL